MKAYKRFNNEKYNAKINTSVYEVSQIPTPQMQFYYIEI